MSLCLLLSAHSKCNATNRTKTDQGHNHKIITQSYQIRNHNVCAVEQCSLGDWDMNGRDIFGSLIKVKCYTIEMIVHGLMVCVWQMKLKEVIVLSLEWERKTKRIIFWVDFGRARRLTFPSHGNSLSMNQLKSKSNSHSSPLNLSKILLKCCVVCTLQSPQSIISSLNWKSFLSSFFLFSKAN